MLRKVFRPRLAAVACAAGTGQVAAVFGPFFSDYRATGRDDNFCQLVIPPAARWRTNVIKRQIPRAPASTGSKIHPSEIN